MQILLAAATTFEIQPTIDAIARNIRTRTSSSSPRIERATPGATDATEPPITGSSPRIDASTPSPAHLSQPLITGRHDIQPLITGIGGIATTWSLMRQIDRTRPDLIIQAGIAGCLQERKPGEVFVIGEDELADLGVWEDGRFKTLFDMHLAGPDEAPFTRGRLANPYRRLLDLTGLEIVGALTVNEITTNAETILWYQQNTPAVVESMEGGPLHYVCLREDIPFLQLRSVSNTVGVRDKTRWDIKLAISRLNEQLLAILDNPALNKEIVTNPK